MAKKVHKDVVCRKWLDRQGGHKVEKDGRTWFFCSNKCKEKFEKDSEKYLKLVG